MMQLHPLSTQLVAHRGLWQESEERNTPLAFRHAWEQGCGIETDVRDCAGRLVISHDPPTGDELLLEDFLTMYVTAEQATPLALNIKSDGLANRLRSILDQFQIENYYCFDMSLPDSLAYHRAGLKTLGRLSEFETLAGLHPQVCGVWLDAFEGDWYQADMVTSLCEIYDIVCLVSPELHQRPYQQHWEMVASLPTQCTAKLQLCTDYPLRFRELLCPSQP